jgi:hypothetical protein
MDASYVWRSSRAAVLVLFIIAPEACKTRDEANRTTADAGETTETRPRPTPPVIGRDLLALRWIAGTWRGMGETQAPFYERYQFPDDSTLVVEGFADSTLATITDTTRFELRGGILTNYPECAGQPGARRSYASALSADSVRFEPLVGTGNNYVWRRTNDADTWEAVLTSPGGSAPPKRTVIYTMRRWR